MWLSFVSFCSLYHCFVRTFNNILFYICRQACSKCVRTNPARSIEPLKQSQSVTKHSQNDVVPYRRISSAAPRTVHVFFNAGNQQQAVILRRLVSREKCLRSVMNSSMGVSRYYQPRLLVPQVIVYTTNARDASTSSRLLNTIGKFLRIRYLILVGTVGGGMAAKEVSCTE